MPEIQLIRKHPGGQHFWRAVGFNERGVKVSFVICGNEQGYWLTRNASPWYGTDGGQKLNWQEVLHRVSEIVA